MKTLQCKGIKFSFLFYLCFDSFSPIIVLTFKSLNWKHNLTYSVYRRRPFSIEYHGEKRRSFLSLCRHSRPVSNWPRTDTQRLFFKIPKLLGLERQIGQIKSGAFWVFLAKLSTLILIQWVRCPCFPLFKNYFYKKLRYSIHIPNIYLGKELGI